MKNLMYYVVVITLGGFMIWQLCQSPELHNIKADIESKTWQINKIIEEVTGD